MNSALQLQDRQSFNKDHLSHDRSPVDNRSYLSDVPLSLQTMFLTVLTIELFRPDMSKLVQHVQVLNLAAIDVSLRLFCDLLRKQSCQLRIVSRTQVDLSHSLWLSKIDQPQDFIGRLQVGSKESSRCGVHVSFLHQQPDGSVQLKHDDQRSSHLERQRFARHVRWGKATNKTLRQFRIRDSRSKEFVVRHNAVSLPLWRAA